MSSTREVMRRRPRPDLTHPHYRPRGGARTGVRILIGVVIVAVLIVVGALGALFWALHQPQSGSPRSITFHVAQGDTVATVADRLSTDGIVGSPLLFRLDAKLRGLGGRLKVGDYPLRANMSIDETVTALTVYHARTVGVTVPEGYRMEQIAIDVKSHGISASQFLALAAHPGNLHISILNDKPAGSSLEGYLFPNTYDVPPHYSGTAFARYMVQTLNKKFTPAMRAQAARSGFSVYQVLTLASIVEREAKVPEERPVIASVYLNRLRIGMKLQADPTVQYAAGTPGNWWPQLQTEAVNVDPGSVYNTYTHAGLPPGPIANPGLASIKAVLYPRRTRYLYFVAKGHGMHAFATSYAEQLANEQKYSTPTSQG